METFRLILSVIVQSLVFLFLFVVGYLTGWLLMTTYENLPQILIIVFLFVVGYLTGWLPMTTCENLPRINDIDFRDKFLQVMLALLETITLIIGGTLIVIALFANNMQQTGSDSDPNINEMNQEKVCSDES